VFQRIELTLRPRALQLLDYLSRTANSFKIYLRRCCQLTSHTETWALVVSAYADRF